MGISQRRYGIVARTTNTVESSLRAVVKLLLLVPRGILLWLWMPRDVPPPLFSWQATSWVLYGLFIAVQPTKKCLLYCRFHFLLLQIQSSVNLRYQLLCLTAVTSKSGIHSSNCMLPLTTLTGLSPAYLLLNARCFLHPYVGAALRRSRRSVGQQRAVSVKRTIAQVRQTKEIQLAGSLQKAPALAKLSPAAALQQSLSSYLSVILLG